MIMPYKTYKGLESDNRYICSVMGFRVQIQVQFAIPFVTTKQHYLQNASL